MGSTTPRRKGIQPSHIPTSDNNHARTALVWRKIQTHTGSYFSKPLLILTALALTGIITLSTAPAVAELSHFSHDIPSQADDSQLERAAARGNAQAQYMFGAMLMVRAEREERSGWKTKSRIYYKQAANWFHKAAASGHGRAQFSLGLLQRNGLGVERNITGALRWLRTAANQNVPDALFLMGVMAAGGEGMRRDQNRALNLLIQAGMGFLEEGRPDWTLEVSQTISQVAPGHPAASELAQAAQHLGNGPGAVQSGFSTGTAWIAPPGYAVTNLHVVEGRSSISLVHPDGSYIPAKVAVSDAENDLVLLAVDDPCSLPPALPLAKEAPGLGAEVFTVGFPQVAIMGSSPKLSTGRITGNTGVGGDIRTMTISVPVAQGNSGGPLVNLRGEVVGIIQAMIDAEGVYRVTGELPENANYAIRVQLLQQLIERLPNQGGGITGWVKNMIRKPCPPTNEPILDSMEAHATKTQVSTLLVVAE